MSLRPRPGLFDALGASLRVSQAPQAPHLPFQVGLSAPHSEQKNVVFSFAILTWYLNMGVVFKQLLSWGMANEHVNASQYDHSLTYFFWAWGCADGFGDKSGEGGGFYEHRRQSTSRLLEMIRQGNPWVPDPKSGRAAVDFLWATNHLPKDDFLSVMEACLTHPQAPDPSTWSTRDVFNSQEKVGIPSTKWIMAMVRHPLGPDMVMPYVRLGGRLDAVDQHGYGVLANCQHLSWPNLEKFLAAAQVQGVSVMAAPEGKTWMSKWAVSSPTELADAQNKISALSSVYPKACQLLTPPEDEMCSTILSTEGMRPTSSAWKRLDMDKVLREDPKAFRKVFFHALAVAKLVSGLNFHSNNNNTKYSTLSFLAGKLSKLCVHHGGVVDDYQAMAAVLSPGSGPEKVKNSFSLLSSGKQSIPATPGEFAAWARKITHISEKLDEVSDAIRDYGWRSRTMDTFVPRLAKFVFTSPSISQDRALAFLDVLLDRYEFHIGQRKLNYSSWSSRIGCEDLIEQVARLSLTEKQKKTLLQMALDTMYSRPDSAFVSRLGKFLQGDFESERLYTDASPWFKETLDGFVSRRDFPQEVLPSLLRARQTLSASLGQKNYMSEHVKAVSSYLGNSILRIQSNKAVNSSTASSAPKI